MVFKVRVTLMVRKSFITRSVNGELLVGQTVEH